MVGGGGKQKTSREDPTAIWRLGLYDPTFQWMQNIMGGAKGYQKFRPEGYEGTTEDVLGGIYGYTDPERQARSRIEQLQARDYMTPEDIARGGYGLELAGRTAGDWMRPEETGIAQTALFGGPTGGRGPGPVGAGAPSPGTILSSYKDPLEYIKPKSEHARKAMEAGQTHLLEELTTGGKGARDLAKARMEYGDAMQQAGFAPGMEKLMSMGAGEAAGMFGVPRWAQMSGMARPFYDREQMLQQQMIDKLSGYESQWRQTQGEMGQLERQMLFAQPWGQEQTTRKGTSYGLGGK